MGYTFASALVKKTGTAPATRKMMRTSLENLGYSKAASAEEASLSLRLYQHKKSAWLSMALEMPEDLDKELEFLRKLAEEMHTGILYFMNFDSDLLFLAATDGKRVQHLHIGFCEEDELPPDSDDLSLFDGMLPDDAARAEFRRIIAVDMEDRIFSESAAQELAPLFGYTPEVLFTDEDTPVFAELNLNLPGNEAVSFLMPEDAPPALRIGKIGLENPSEAHIFSNGGVGKGIRVVLQADGYDAHDWELPVLRMNYTHRELEGCKCEQQSYDVRVVPRRVTFQDGKEGWLAEFPEAPIYRGVNPASPLDYSAKGYNYHYAYCSVLHIAFCGGTFTPEMSKLPDAEMLGDPAEMLEWSWQRKVLQEEEGKTHMWIVPMENPENGAHYAIPRKPFRRDFPNDWLRGYWPEDQLK